MQNCYNSVCPETKLGRILGPFNQPPLHNWICSPVRMVPKKNTTEMRMITHPSYPHRNSINSHIDPADTKTQYQSFDAALKLVAAQGKGAYMLKGDVKLAFWLVPIRPQDWHLLGSCFQQQYYIDICLHFGASISCAIFEKVGSLLQWIAQKHAYHPIVWNLDDFFTSHEVQWICDQIWIQFSNLVKRLEFPWLRTKG